MHSATPALSTLALSGLPGGHHAVHHPMPIAAMVASCQQLRRALRPVYFEEHVVEARGGSPEMRQLAGCADCEWRSKAAASRFRRHVDIQPAPCLDCSMSGHPGRPRSASPEQPCAWWVGWHFKAAADVLITSPLTSSFSLVGVSTLAILPWSMMALLVAEAVGSFQIVGGEGR